MLNGGISVLTTGRVFLRLGPEKIDYFDFRVLTLIFRNLVSKNQSKLPIGIEQFLIPNTLLSLQL